MGCAGAREKIEDQMMLMKLERMEVQMEKEKELKKLSEIEGHTIKGQKIPDYIDPKFAKEKQIYDDDDEENGVKKTDDARKKDKKSDKNKKDKKETKDKDKKKEKNQLKDKINIYIKMLINVKKNIMENLQLYKKMHFYLKIKIKNIKIIFKSFYTIV